MTTIFTRYISFYQHNQFAEKFGKKTGIRISSINHASTLGLNTSPQLNAATTFIIRKNRQKTRHENQSSRCTGRHDAAPILSDPCTSPDGLRRPEHPQSRNHPGKGPLPRRVPAMHQRKIQGMVRRLMKHCEEP